MTDEEQIVIEGENDEAIDALYREAIRRDPGDADAYINLGASYEWEGYPDRARAAYEKALILDPDNGKAWENLRDLDAGE